MIPRSPKFQLSSRKQWKLTSTSSLFNVLDRSTPNTIDFSSSFLCHTHCCRVSKFRDLLQLHLRVKMAQKSPRETPGIRYVTFNTSHLDDLVDFLLEHFYSKIVWGISLGLNPEKEVKPWLRPLLEYRLKLGFSVGAWDDDTNQLVGVASNEVKLSSPSQFISQDQLVTSRYPNAHKNVGLIRALHGGRDLLEMCQVQSFGRIAQLSVRSDYEGRGIASQLVERSEKVFLEKDVLYVYVETVNEFSAGLFQRKGYDVVAELAYADYKENGEVVFKNTGIHRTCRLFIKALAAPSPIQCRS